MAERKKLEPIGYEDVDGFVDYADRPGEFKKMRLPVHDVPPYCTKLRVTRVNKQMTLMKAAELLGLSPAELSGIEHGRLECGEEEASKFIDRIHYYGIGANTTNSKDGKSK